MWDGDVSCPQLARVQLANQQVLRIQNFLEEMISAMTSSQIIF